MDPKKDNRVDAAQLVAICEEHSLLLGLIHACNNGLGDYILPLTHMAKILVEAEAGDTVGNEAALYAGHLLLSYLALLMAGQALPAGRCWRPSAPHPNSPF